MQTALLFVLALWIVEILVMNERPAWLSRIARLALTQSRRLPVAPVARVIDDAAYREPAFELRDPLSQIRRFSVGALHIEPIGRGDAFVAMRRGWTRKHIVRIDVQRDGEHATLTARFAPVPLAMWPFMALVVINALLRGTGGEGGAYSGGMLGGLLVGMVIGWAVHLGRARSGAEELAGDALDVIEAEIARISAGRPADEPEPHRASAWRGRVIALGPALLALALLAHMGPSSNATTVRGLMEQYGLDEPQARRLLVVSQEAAAALTSHPLLRERHADGSLSQGELESLTRAGVPRLNDWELLEREAMKVRLAASSDVLCAQLGSGLVDPRALISTLASTDDETLRAWFRLAARAAVLELDRVGAALPEDPDVIVDDGLLAMIASLPEAEQSAYEARLWPEVETHAAWCDSFRATSEGLARLPPAERARMIRAIETRSLLASPP